MTLRDRLVAAGLLLGMVLLASATAGLTRAFHAHERELAERWTARGEEDLREGRGREAVRDFRNALTHARHDPAIQLRLAQALLAAGRPGDARPWLLTLWSRQPGNGTVNLELARIAMQQGEIEEAQRYYSGATYGLWETNPAERRRAVRLELAQQLLQRGLRRRAAAELIALSADTPTDAGSQAMLGDMFARAGDNPRALEHYRLALTADPAHKVALLGAGRAAFELSQFRDARSLLQRAVKVPELRARAEPLLETAELVLQWDPFQPRLGAWERARRASRAFRVALERVRECLAPGPQPDPILATLHERASEVEADITTEALRRDPDRLDDTMALVFRMEHAASQSCGTAEGPHRALEVVGRLRGDIP